MAKFIINHTLSGFEQADIDDSRLCNKDNTIVLVLDESTSTALYKYYNRVIDIILSGAKLITICVGKESKIRKTIMMLMVSYRNYNIYRVNSLSIVTDEYVANIEVREPSLLEVQQYVGGDISAYSELTTILFGINELINAGDLDGLKVFLEQHLESLDKSIDVVEYLKRISDATNSGELSSIIDSLKNKLDTFEKENSSIRAELKQYKGENSKLSDTVATLRKDVANANKKAFELQNQLDNATNSPVITSYREVNTSLIRCRAQSILYFKEISYARYTNSLVSNILNILKTIHHVNVKLLIYDSNVGIPGVYKGISILNSAEYLASKDKIIKSTVKFVVAEPNQMFIEDVLTSIDPQFQVVIVYDRLRQPIDIVSGNNVTKIYVVNSASNFAAVKPNIRVSLGSLILSSEANIDGCISIPEIPGYSQNTDSAKISKYMKLTNHDGKPIINTILNAARISMRPGGGV